MFIPMDCRAINNTVAAAGGTAAIAVFFNPVVGAVFGAVAGIAAIMSAGFGC